MRNPYSLKVNHQKVEYIKCIIKNLKVLYTNFRFLYLSFNT